MIKELRGKSSVLPVLPETTRDEIKAFVRKELGNKICYVCDCYDGDTYFYSSQLAYHWRYDNGEYVRDDDAIIETHTNFILAEIKTASARFETGKTYLVNGSGEVTILKRSKCYVTVSGAYNGRLLIRNWPKGGEVLAIPTAWRGIVLCFAWNNDKATIKQILLNETEA